MRRRKPLVSLNLCECGFGLASNLLPHFCSLAQGHRESIFKRSGCRLAKKLPQITAVFGPALRISGGITECVHESMQKKPGGTGMTHDWSSCLGHDFRLAAENPLPECALNFRHQRAPLVGQKLDGAGLILEQF